VLHISKSCTATKKEDAYYYLVATKGPSDGKTWCGRMTAAVNCASEECAYSKDELCVSCLGKTSACEETTA
jgi:hypothetical protein